MAGETRILLWWLLFGGTYLLVNPFGGDWIFFGGFVVYTFLSAAHQDRRTLASGRPEGRYFAAAAGCDSLW